MIFNSVLFIFLFLPLTLVFYRLVKPNFRSIVLLLASIVFYAWGEQKGILIILFSIAVNYLLALLLEKSREHGRVSGLALLLALFFNVGLLVVFKYLLGGSADYAIPLGISFFTFKALSYVFDVFYRISPARKNILDLALYLSFFPQVSMGPIQKYGDFENTLATPQLNIPLFFEGTQRFIFGLSKKMVIAAQIQPLTDYIYGLSPDVRGSSLAWLGALAYLLQLYFDFSGYCDMAVGLSKMFGLSAPENFDYPYCSRRIAEFWRRWHSTLGEWFKDYLYTPVFRFCLRDGSPFRGSLLACDLATLFVVWAFVGIWHGAGAKFFAYGMGWFVFIALERILEDSEKKRRKRLKLPKKQDTVFAKILSHAYVLLVVLFLQVMFRSDGLRSTLAYYKDMLLPGEWQADQTAEALYLLSENWVVLVIGILLSCPLYPALMRFFIKQSTNKIRCTTFSVSGKILLGVLFFAGIAFTVSSRYNPFIYFNF